MFSLRRKLDTNKLRSCFVTSQSYFTVQNKDGKGRVLLGNLHILMQVMKRSTEVRDIDLGNSYKLKLLKLKNSDVLMRSELNISLFSNFTLNFFCITRFFTVLNHYVAFCCVSSKNCDENSVSLSSEGEAI